MKTNSQYRQDDSQPSKANPEILYKYRSLEGNHFKFTRDIFAKNELYFPHPDKINDPFDCKIPPSYWKNITKEKILTDLENIKSRTNNETDLAEIELSMSNVHENNIETIIKAIKDQYEKNDFGILSFTDKPLNICMWSHYADSHKGICIGFDYYKLSFIFDGTPLNAGNVKYPKFNHYPKCDYFEMDHQKQFYNLFFTKSLDWEYEQEWRILFPEKGNTPQQFNPDAIISVYLGCKISQEHKETIISLCSQRMQKPKIYEVTKDESSYSLNENEITY